MARHLPASLYLLPLMLAAGCVQPEPGEDTDSSSGAREPTTTATTFFPTGDDIIDPPSVLTTTDGPDTDTPGDDDDATFVACTPGAVELCRYTGPEHTANIGACQPATRECQPSGTWGACTGEVLPQTENCRTFADDNCDGATTCTGAITWLRGFGEPTGDASGSADVDAAAVDDQERLWLLGSNQKTMRFGATTWDSGNADKFYLARIAADGTPEYAHADARPGALNYGRALSIAPGGAVAVSVTSQNTVQLAAGAPILDGAPSLTSTGIGVFDRQGAHRRSIGLSNLDAGNAAILDIAHDSAGNLWIAGRSHVSHVKVGLDPKPLLIPNHGGSDVLLIKLAPDGSLVQAHGLGDSGDQTVHRIAVDASDNVWMLGWHDGTIQFDGGALHADESAEFIAELDSEGRWIWGHSYGASDSRRFSELAVADDGDVLVAGVFTSQELLVDAHLLGKGAGDSAVFIVRYDADATARWAHSWPCVGSCYINSMAVDGAGQVVITADISHNSMLTAAGTSLYGDAALVKLDRDGGPVWAPRSYDAELRVAVGPSGSIYLTGRFSQKVSFTDGPGFTLDAGASDFDVFAARLLP